MLSQKTLTFSVTFSGKPKHRKTETNSRYVKAETRANARKTLTYKPVRREYLDNLRELGNTEFFSGCRNKVPNFQ